MTALWWSSLAGIGLALVFLAKSEVSRQSKRFTRGSYISWADLSLALGSGLAVFTIKVPVLAVITFFTVAGALRQRRESAKRRVVTQRSAAWPDAIDFLISSIRSGMSVGSALIALHDDGPQVLRPVLSPARQALQDRATVSDALRLLRAHADDPVADRVCLTLEISQEVGGTSLLQVLRSLAQYVREENRTRAELISRQAWTTNAAKLAVAAPWLIVLLLSLRAHDAYATTAGSLMLILGAAASAVGYVWMVRASRLPMTRRLA